MTRRASNEVTRFKKFQRVLLGKKEEVNVVDIDIRNYMRFILREGEDSEKRELLGCLTSRISLKEKKLTLVTN